MSEPRSRRRFLRETAFGVAALATARVLPVSAAPETVPDEIAAQLRFFSPHEYLIVSAAGKRIAGVDTEGIDIALRADAFLSGADPEIQDQFHLLLTIFNSPLFGFLFDLRTSQFIDMSPEEQDAYLDDWMTSRIAFRRTGFQALKRTSMSMYYTDSRSWDAIGYTGEFLPWERGGKR